MSREVPNDVHYEFDISTTVLLGVDFQLAFGEKSWEPVPDAATAVANFRAAGAVWRSVGGEVIHLVTTYTEGRAPTGRMTDFLPDVGKALDAATPTAASYPDLVGPDELVINKTTFSGVLSSDLVDQLRSRGADSVVIGGLTTPVCVQTTADNLSMCGFKVTVLSDCCASEAIGRLSARETHDVALERLAYVFGVVVPVADFIADVRSSYGSGVGESSPGRAGVGVANYVDDTVLRM